MVDTTLNPAINFVQHVGSRPSCSASRLVQPMGWPPVLRAVPLLLAANETRLRLSLYCRSSLLVPHKLASVFSTWITFNEERNTEKSFRYPSRLLAEYASGIIAPSRQLSPLLASTFELRIIQPYPLPETKNKKIQNINVV